MRFASAGHNVTWAPLSASQTVRVDMSWDKTTNNVALWLNDVLYEYSIDLSQVADVNRVDLGLMGMTGEVTGELCVGLSNRVCKRSKLQRISEQR